MGRVRPLPHTCTPLSHTCTNAVRRQTWFHPIRLIRRERVAYEGLTSVSGFYLFIENI